MTYIQFCNEISGYTFWKGNRQIYRFEMYWSGLTPSQCFEKFDTRVIIKKAVND
jgi:hypothetical protein